MVQLGRTGDDGGAVQNLGGCFKRIQSLFSSSFAFSNALSCVALTFNVLVANIIPSNYPALDITPPINSTEVQQWIQEVADSGVVIPDIPPTVGGAACGANPAAAANESICWWTCGGCHNAVEPALFADR